MSTAFLTGSRVYGIAREDSDLDLVVLMSQSDIDTLGSEFPIRFGKLNIIALTNEDELAQWRAARLLCLAEKPVTRERAVEIHKQCGIVAGEVSKTKAQLIAEGVL